MQKALAVFLLFAPLGALAQATADAAPADAAMGQPSAIMNMLPLLLIFAVFYFVLIKPQQKRLRQHQELLGGLKKGDKIVTGGGIVGKITKVAADDTFSVEIAPGVEISVLKSTVSGLHGVTAPAPADKKKAAGDKNDNKVVSRDSIANDN